jgi:hypothetical protein
MSGKDDEIDIEEDLLGPDLEAENLVDEAPPATEVPSTSLMKRSRSYPINRKGGMPRKSTPERLGRALSYAAEMPVGADVARRLGVNVSTLKYWLQKSLEGGPGDGFDVVLGEDDENSNEDNTVRFHEAFDLAMEAGVEQVEAATHRRAIGYREPLIYRGRVQYQYDTKKLALSRELGLPEMVAENYLLDEFGAPVPETVLKQDPDLAMFILKSRKASVYGDKSRVDVNVRGGVLVVGMRATTSEALNEMEAGYRKAGRPAVTFEEGDDEE